MSGKTKDTIINYPLNHLQKRFVEEYLLDPSNHTKAALRAGYSESNSRRVAWELLKDPRVKKLIEERQEDAERFLGVDRIRVLQELSNVAFANIQDVLSQDENGNTTIHIGNLKRADAAGISEVTITTDRNGIQVAKIKMVDKNTALEKLGKHLRMFKEQVEVSGNVNLLQLVEASITAHAQIPQTEHTQIIDTTYTDVTPLEDNPQPDLFLQGEASDSVGAEATC